MSDNKYSNQKLHEALLHYPPSQRFFTGEGLRLLSYFCDNACVLGYGTYDGVMPLNHIPQNTKGLYMYYGAGVKNLLAELLKTDIAANLEHLVIGVTVHHAENDADYSEISRLLSQVSFPKLRHLEYGINEMIANTLCIYGNLGNITPMLQNMPNLETLDLYGNFKLTQPVQLLQLIKLETRQNEIGINTDNGKISNHTLQQLLTSRFDWLKILSLNLSYNDDLHEYSLPAAFVNGQSTPKLEALELYGQFTTGTKQQIGQSSFLRRRTNIENVDEPET